MTAANKAKKNPAIPVAPTSKTIPLIKTGTSVKNFSLYAMSNGSMNFLYCFLTRTFLRWPLRPSSAAILLSAIKEFKYINVIFVKNCLKLTWSEQFPNVIPNESYFMHYIHY